MSEYGYRRVGRFIVPAEYQQRRGIPADSPVVCTIQVTRINHVRRYTLRFATFREAVTRLTRLKAKYRGFHWAKTELAY